MPDATPIPDAEVEQWPGAKRVVIGPPVGHDPTGPIRPIEAIVDDDYGVLRSRAYCTRWVFSDEEIMRLSLGEPVYVIVQYPSMVPISLGMLEPVQGTLSEAAIEQARLDAADALCPSCGSTLEEDAHRDGCERIGTCGQYGPPWLAAPWHPLPERPRADWLPEQLLAMESIVDWMARHRSMHNHPSTQEPDADG